MARNFVILLVCLSIVGCARMVKVPVGGGAAFNDCSNANCKIELLFPADSILAIEGATQAKSIYYAGQIFVIGDGFSRLWKGKIMKDYLAFESVYLESPPVTNSVFDWQRGLLKISWIGSDGIPYWIYFNQEGKQVEE